MPQRTRHVQPQSKGALAGCCALRSWGDSPGYLGIPVRIYCTVYVGRSLASRCCHGTHSPRLQRCVHPTGHAKGMQFHSPGVEGLKIMHSEGALQSVGIVRPIQGRCYPCLCTQGGMPLACNTSAKLQNQKTAKPDTLNLVLDMGHSGMDWYRKMLRTTSPSRETVSTVLVSNLRFDRSQIPHGILGR